jgi:hypothetical protein
MKNIKPFNLFINEDLKTEPIDCDGCKYFDFSSLLYMYSGLEKPLYYMINKGELYKLNYISPKEYLTIVANNFGKSYDDMINSNVILKDKIDKYADDMKKGDKFPIPYHTIGKSSQEGRHRALACLKLGVKKIPVVSIEPIDYKTLPLRLSKFKGLSFEEVDKYFKNKGYDGITNLDYRELTRFLERD